MPGNEEASGEMHQVVKLDEPGRVELAPGRRVAEDRLLLGGEDEVAAELGDEQRAHAEAVAGEEELLLAAVPDGEGEVAVHPVEAGGPHSAYAWAITSVSLVVARPRGLELGPELDVVVDLAVLHHPVAAVLARTGPRPRGRRWRDGCSSSRSGPSR